MPESHKGLYIGLGVGAGTLLLGTGVALRLRQLSKEKSGAAVPNTTPIPSGAPAGAITPGTAAPVPPSPSVSPAVNANLAAASAAGVSAADIVAAQILASQDSNAGTAGAAPVSAAGQSARVVTNDPPPAGDLIIRDAPSASANQVGGAEKDGEVIILNDTDPVFAKIAWGGGSRWPAVTGFARKAFLALT